MNAKKIYAIANSHLDPIWLWNRSSGNCSMINTIRSVVAILKDNPDVKFTCSSASMYRWCEDNTPGLFADVLELARRGQWEPVGGWEVQSDAIITRLEVLLRQAEIGQEYFARCFGKPAKIAYSVDSFGHTAMLPSILRKHGLAYFVYGRGQDELPWLFRWKAADGSEVIAHRFLDAYASPETMTHDEFIARISKHYNSGNELQTFFYGIGDHGGGIYRKHIEWIREAQKDFPICFSTLEEYFHDVEQSGMELPEYCGEIAPQARGTYAICRTVKEQAARTVRHLLKAERLGAPEKVLAEPWREVVYDHFHDIMPGTSVRKANREDVASSLGHADFCAVQYIDRQLTRMDNSADLSFVTEGGVQIWNPNPFPVNGLVSVDAYSDPNATGKPFCSLKTADGKLLPLQILPGTTSYGPCMSPWGRLTAVVPLAPMEQKFLAYSRETVPADANLGFEKQRAMLKKMSFPVLYDNNGIWGFTMQPYGIAEEQAELTETSEFANGPVCSILTAKYRFKSSSLFVEMTCWKGIDEVGIRITADWHETYSCLKLKLDNGDAPKQIVTGNAGGITQRYLAEKCGTMLRTADGKNMRRPFATQEWPFCDFSAAEYDGRTLSVFAPDIYGCDAADGCLRITLLRPARPADFVIFPSFEREGWMDIGFTHLALWISDSSLPVAKLPRAAAARLMTAEVREVTGHSPDCNFAEPLPAFPVLTDSHCEAESIRHGKATIWNPSEVEQGIRIGEKTFSIMAHGIAVVESDWSQKK